MAVLIFQGFENEPYNGGREGIAFRQPAQQGHNCDGN